MNLFVRRSAEDVFFERQYDGTFGRTDAAVRVNGETAFTDDAILAAVSLLAGDIAGLPMRAFQTAGGLTQPLERQPAWIEAPDPLDLAITDVAHRMQVALSLLIAGNAYVLCEPSVFDPVSLTVLDPTRVRVCKPGRERTFEVMSRSEADGPWQPGDVQQELSSAQVLHIPYLLRPGRLEGLSPIAAQAGNIGISIAMRKWVETFFGKGGQVSGLVSLPVGATGQDVDGVQSRIQSKWSSWRKAGVIGVLGGGATFIRTGLSPQDADLGALWRRQLEMAARIYGIPPFMIGSQEPAGVAYASSVERAQHYIDHCLARYTRPIEKAYSRLVPGASDEVRFVFDAFLRGDPKARWETYLAALNAKARTVGEVRALENLPPLGEYQQNDPNGFLNTPNNQSPDPRFEQAGQLIRAGFDPEASLAAVGLPVIKHLGLPPVTVQSDAAAPPAGRSLPEEDDDVRNLTVNVNQPDVAEALREMRQAAEDARLANASLVERAQRAEEHVARMASRVMPAPIVNVEAAAPIVIPAPQVTVDVPRADAPVVNVTTPDVQLVQIVGLPPLNAKVKRGPDGRVSGISEG